MNQDSINHSKIIGQRQQLIPILQSLGDPAKVMDNEELTEAVRLLARMVEELTHPYALQQEELDKRAGRVPMPGENTKLLTRKPQE